MPVDRADLHAQKKSNRFQSALLMLGMTAIMIALGWILLGRSGVYVALGVCLASVLIGPRVSPTMVIRLYKGQPIDPRQSGDLYEVVTELARRAELPKVPTLYYIPTRMLNAFAVGTEKNSGIALTDGLLRALTPRELVGVLAHEISHINHHDTRVMGLADVVSRLTGTLSQIGQVLLLLQIPAVLIGTSVVGLTIWQILAMVFAPMASSLLQLALSRQREFHADTGAVELTGDPAGLASALRKLEQYQDGNWLQKVLLPQRAPAPAVLRTHPATQDRIDRLSDLLDQPPPVTQHQMSAQDATTADHLCDQCGPQFRRRPRMHLSGLWY